MNLFFRGRGPKEVGGRLRGARAAAVEDLGGSHHILGAHFIRKRSQVQARYQGVGGYEGALTAHAAQSSGSNEIPDGPAHRNAGDAIGFFQEPLTGEDITGFEGGIT